MSNYCILGTVYSQIFSLWVELFAFSLDVPPFLPQSPEIFLRTRQELYTFGFHIVIFN